MARNIAIGVNWNDRQGRIDYPAIIERVKIADAAGVHSVWIPEGWGRDVFTLLALLAYETDRIRLGTGIVNVYSRTPAALAQHFATLDELSEGRMLIGLGTSGAQVIEHFHGVPFEPPRTRLKEYIEIMQTLLKGEKLHYEGTLFDLRRGFTLRFQPVRDRIPIHLATLNPKALKLTAELADGWLPIWFSPYRMSMFTADLEKGFARAGNGKSLDTFDIVAGCTVVIGDDVEACLAQLKPTLALYVGGMGAKGRNFHNEMVSKYGYADVAAEIQDLYLAGRKREATDMVPDELCDEISLCGSPARIRERFGAWQQAGVKTMMVQSNQPEALALMADVAGTTA